MTDKIDPECRKILWKMLNKQYERECVLAWRAMVLAEDIRNGTKKICLFIRKIY